MLRYTLSLLVLGGLMLGSADAVEDQKQAKPAQQKVEQPTVEVVFCLDTTGSMSGLIQAAKEKIWAISNQIAGAKPTPRVRIGLVAYRDRADQYVTQVHDLTDDLDAMYGHLMKFQAQGGGDFPESVNQALQESVTKISWSKDKKTLKLIFLVGDAPPHMDYQETQYPEICKLAVKQDIIINTVQCGSHAQTQKYWQEICRLAEGSYVQIDARGGPVVVVKTPFDEELAKLNRELVSCTVVYGDRRTRAEGEAKKDAAASLPAPAAAERAGFAGKSGKAAAYDLIDSLRDGKVKLTDLEDEQLPDELRKLTSKQRQEHLKQLEQKRGELTRRAANLDRQRAEFITRKLAADKTGAANSFDGQVLSILQRQAQRTGLRYGAVETPKKE